MAKPKTAPAPRTPASPVPPAAPSPGLSGSARELIARTSPVPWYIAFTFLILLAWALVWMPLGRISAHYEISHNEGWNAYLQQVVADGGHIYGQAPVYTYANYPMLSFHVVGLLGRLTHDVNLTGRWISLFAFAALAVISGLVSGRLTGSRRCGLFSALAVVIFIGTMKADRIGMNDPHLLGMAFVALGFYAYVRAPESTLWLRLSAIAFVLGLFTKQTLLPFPLAVAIQLFLTSRKRLVEWLSTGAALSVLLLALTYLLDGSHFLEHLAFPRLYSYAFFLSNTVWYLLFFQTALIVALVWCFQNARSSPAIILVWAFVLSHVLAFFYSGGAGADLNNLFDPAVAVAMIGGVALPYAVWASERVRFRNCLLTILLTVPFFLGTLTMLAPHIQEDQGNHRLIPQLEQEFAGAVNFVQSRPGPALCESLLLCFEAGKPNEFDAYIVDQLVKTGKTPEAGILKLLDEHHFSTIQLVNDPNDPIAPAERMRFSQAFMTRLLADYRVAMRTSTYAIFTPAQ